MMRRVMDAGALGCEIVISGKLTGPRSRSEKFISGYIKHSGKPAIDLVDKGYSVAVKKLGVIGCQVRIIPPEVRLPDDFRIVQPPAPVAEEKKPAASAPAAPTAAAAPQAATAEQKKSDLDQLLEAEPAAQSASAEPVPEPAPGKESAAADEPAARSPDVKPSAGKE
jgi:small subunit ribosomal protein S3